MQTGEVSSAPPGALANRLSSCRFVNMITVDEERPLVVVASLTPLAGFTLGDGLILPSPILVINNIVYMWDVGPPSEDGNWEGFEEEALKVFEIISPRPGECARRMHRIRAHEMVQRSFWSELGSGGCSLPHISSDISTD